MAAHAHDHSHPHVHAGEPHPHNAPGHSLLRMSVGARLGIAGVFVAAIWLAVAWAIA